MNVPELQPGWTLLLYFSSDFELSRVMFVPTDLITEPLRHLLGLMERHPGYKSVDERKEVTAKISEVFAPWAHEFGHYCIRAAPERRFLHIRGPVPRMYRLYRN